MGRGLALGIGTPRRPLGSQPGHAVRDHGGGDGAAAIGPQPHPSFIEVFGEASLRDRYGTVAGAGARSASALMATGPSDAQARSKRAESGRIPELT